MENWPSRGFGSNPGASARILPTWRVSVLLSCSFLSGLKTSPVTLNQCKGGLNLGCITAGGCLDGCSAGCCRSCMSLGLVGSDKTCFMFSFLDLAAFHAYLD